MIRVIAGWGLIFIGLVGVVGGLGMGYIASLIDTKPTEAERAAYRSTFHMDGIEPPSKSVMPQFLAAGLSVAIGGVLLCVGLPLRAPGVEQGKRAKKHKKKAAAVEPHSVP